MAIWINFVVLFLLLASGIQAKCPSPEDVYNDIVKKYPKIVSKSPIILPSPEGNWILDKKEGNIVEGASLHEDKLLPVIFAPTANPDSESVCKYAVRYFYTATINGKPNHRFGFVYLTFKKIMFNITSSPYYSSTFEKAKIQLTGEDFCSYRIRPSETVPNTMVITLKGMTGFHNMRLTDEETSSQDALDKAIEEAIKVCREQDTSVLQEFNLTKLQKYRPSHEAAERDWASQPDCTYFIIPDTHAGKFTLAFKARGGASHNFKLDPDEYSSGPKLSATIEKYYKYCKEYELYRTIVGDDAFFEDINK